MARRNDLVPSPSRLQRLVKESDARSLTSRLGSPSGASSTGRDSILEPLGALSSLKEAEEMIHQVGINLSFVDEQLV